MEYFREGGAAKGADDHHRSGCTSFSKRSLVSKATQWTIDTLAPLHQPQFAAFRTRYDLPFEPYKHYGKEEQTKRRALLLGLVNQIWSPERLRAAAA